MKQDNMPQVARFWNAIAAEFDSIYTGANKSGLRRFMDKYFRKDIYQRFDWVMQKCGDVRGKTICDIGCGSGRFVTQFAKNGAEHLAKFFVLGMDEVRVAVFLGFERKDESVREAFVVFLGTHVRTPFERHDLRNLSLQSAKGVFRFLDLFFRGRVLELEGHDVAKFCVFRRSLSGKCAEADG